MKTRIIIFSLCLLSLNMAQAGLKKQRELKNEVNNCENALKACLSTKAVVIDTIVIYTGKQAQKVAKQSEKTKRKLSIQTTKQIKSENKVEVKTDKFRNFMNGITRITAILMAGGFFAAGGIGLKILQFAKDRVKWLSWLPV